MLRVGLYLNQYEKRLPIMEVAMNFYHDETLKDELTVHDFIVNMVTFIEEMVDSYNGEFVSVIPRGTRMENAKLATFVTVAFKRQKDMKNFEKELVENFE